MTFAGPGGYPRDALSLPIYGLTANACRWVPLMIGVRKRTKATSRTMQKSVLNIAIQPHSVKVEFRLKSSYLAQDFGTV